MNNESGTSCTSDQTPNIATAEDIEMLDKLLRTRGTLTNSNLMDKFVSKGWIRKDGNVLYVDMKLARNCMCHLTDRYEHLESMIRDLKNFFGVEEVVFHHYGIRSENAIVVEVEAGTVGRFSDYPVANPNLGGPCGVYPVIKGLGMKWEFLGGVTRM